MKFAYRQVFPSDPSAIQQVCDLINDAGQHMATHDNLKHWEREYSTQQAIEDCAKRLVFLVELPSERNPLATFQVSIDMGLPEGERTASLAKFATDYRRTGQGIGSAVLADIEDYCQVLGAKTIDLDVYTGSERAIKFYESAGFTRLERRSTRRFEVWIMYKAIQQSDDRSEVHDRGLS